MRWIKGGRLGGAVVAALALSALGSTQEKRIAIFSPQTSFTLPVTERDGRDYVGLVEVLEPLGSVVATSDNNKWKLRFNLREAEFIDRQTLVKINNKNKKFDLPAPFRLEGNHGLVPVAALGPLISQLTGVSPIVFHEDSRRLFVGKVAVRFTEELQKENPPRLVLNFTSPASPTIASEPGKVRLTFTREPIMPPPVSPTKFDDSVITSAQYEETNGIAVLTVFTTSPLLASFSNEGRTLTLTRAPQAQATPQANNAQSPSVQTAGPATNGTPATPPLASGTVEVPETTGTGLRHFFAVIDAAHGGTERGAGLSDALPEKDVVLSFARYLQKELQTRGISALILRDSDATLSLDQRASLANSAHPTLYITMHAASQGRGVRIYTSLLPFSGNGNGPFQPWEAAQAPHVRTAVATADSVASELRKHDIRARVLSAPLRPMNNLIAAAIAIEVAPPDAELPGLVAPNYQQSVASAIADGILAARPQLEAGR
jgi:N-acetylmuramoyl-L-alanine amidase